MTAKKKTILTLILLSVGAFAFWKLYPARPVFVEVVAPIQRAAVQVVYATGSVEANAMIPISPKVSGRLMSLAVDEGSRVQKGEVLAQLEDTDLQQNVNSFQAKFDFSDKALKRAQTLAKSGAISKEAFDQAQANYDSAFAALEKVRAETDYLKLVAPEEGTVIRRDGEIGELIPVGSPVFWINGGDRLRIETEVDEEDIGLVHPGQEVLISADAFPGEIFRGKVLSITPKGDPVSRSYRVRVSFDDSKKLMIGMTAETNIITSEKDKALVIPVSALKDNNVLKISENKVERVVVKTGIKTQDFVEILHGIGEKDTIVNTYDETLQEKKNFRLQWIERKDSFKQ